jgi:hypothetical protein
LPDVENAMPKQKRRGAPVRSIEAPFREALSRQSDNTNPNLIPIYRVFLFDEKKGLGLWPRFRVMFEILSERHGWTVKTLLAAIRLLLVRSEKSSMTSGADQDLDCLVAPAFDESKFPRLLSFKEQLERVMVELAEEPSFLGLHAPAVVKQDYPSMAAFKAAVLAGMSGDHQGDGRRDVLIHTTDVDQVPTFAATSIPAQMAIVGRLQRFLEEESADSAARVIAIAGEAATGRSGIIKQALTDYAASPALNRHIIYTNVSRLQSLDLLLARLNNFSKQVLALEAASEESGLDLENDTQPLEMNVSGFASNIKKAQRGIVFVFGDVAAQLTGPIKGASYRLIDDRLNWLLRIILEQGSDHKVILSLLPAGKLDDLDIERAQVEAYIKPPGLAAIDTFDASFPQAREVLANVNNSFAGFTSDAEVKSTIILGAFALHRISLKYGSSDFSMINAAIAEAVRKQSVNPVLRKVLSTIEADSWALVALAFIALAPEGVRRETLVGFLRYHRELSPMLHFFPEGCLELTRQELTEADTSALKAFEERLAILVDNYSLPPRFRDNEGLSNDGSHVLCIVTGLREALEEELHRNYPELSRLVRRLLAKVSRRVGMRARVATAKPYGKTLEDLQADLATATQLLAAADIKPRIGAPKGLGNGASCKRSRIAAIMQSQDLERRVFTRFHVQPEIIVNFVLSELIRKDIEIGFPEKMSNVWITDDAVLSLLFRFFKLGTPPLATTEAPKLPEKIPPELIASLSPASIAWLITAVAKIAWRLQNFTLLYQAVALEPALIACGARPNELHSLHELKLDYLVGQGKLRASVTSSASAESYAISLLEHFGGFWPADDGASIEDLIGLCGSAKRRAEHSAKALGNSAEALQRRVQILVRLGEVYDLTGRDAQALQAFLEAEEISGHLYTSTGHSILSGRPGRKFLKALIRLAATHFTTSPFIYSWAKVKAEDVHRRRIRRRAALPAERTGILIDEALLERHLRGDAGQGDLQRSQGVLCGERTELAALAAPRIVRLEYLMERVKAAMLMAKGPETNGKAASEHAAAARRDMDLVADIVSKWPERSHARLEKNVINARVHGIPDERARSALVQSGFRADQLIDLVDLHRGSFSNGAGWRGPIVP